MSRGLLSLNHEFMIHQKEDNLKGRKLNSNGREPYVEDNLKCYQPQMIVTGNNLDSQIISSRRQLKTGVGRHAEVCVI